MNQVHHYDDRFKELTTYQVSSTLLKFVLSRLEEDIKSSRSQRLIELGCGNGSLFEFFPDDLKNKEFEAIDFSAAAIKNAKSNFTDSKVRYSIEDVLDINIQNTYSIAIDSHLIHCLIGRTEIKKYLKTIYSSLQVGGKFLIETMVSHKNFENKYLIDFEDSILKDEDGLKIRTLFSAREWEELFLESGFRIDYLIFPYGQKMITDSNREEALEFDPDVLQVVLVKD